MIIEYFLLFQYESIKKYQVLCNGLTPSLTNGSVKYTIETHPLILYLNRGGNDISLINEFMQIQNDSLNNFEYDENTHPLILYKDSGGNDENITCILSHINQKNLKEIESKMTKKYLKYKTKYMALRNTKNKNTHL